jgi:hypothetical protein
MLIDAGEDPLPQYECNIFFNRSGQVFSAEVRVRFLRPRLATCS